MAGHRSLVAALVAALVGGLVACKSPGVTRPSDTTGGDNEPPPGTCLMAANTSARAAVSFADDATFSFVMGKALKPAPNVAMPGKGVVIRDADFGTQIGRVTEKGTDQYGGPGITNEYARNDPENSDGTRLVLSGTDGDWHLYDARTFQRLGTLAIVGGGETPEPRWSRDDPNTFYYLYGAELRSCNVSTKASALVHDFKTAYPQAAWITTKSEGDASTDGRRWCLLVEREDYRRIAVVTYDRVSDRVLGQKTVFRDDVNWVSMSMSGLSCLIGYEDSDTDGDAITPPVEAFTLDFSSSVVMPTGANGHMDPALTADRRDVIVYQNNATDFVEMADLATGAATQLLALGFDVNPDIGLHISGNSDATPGWVLISTYGSKVPPPGSSHDWIDEQLFMLELKPNPRIWRIAHTQAYTSNAFTGEKNYFAECFAAINRAGTRVYFGSNWNVFQPDYADVFVASLPRDWSVKVPGGP